jgi:hypothetical protein
MSPPRFRNGTATIGGSAADVIGLRRIRALDGRIADPDSSRRICSALIRTSS